MANVPHKLKNGVLISGTAQVDSDDIATLTASQTLQNKTIDNTNSVDESALPTNIDATKIANGTVTNSEFQFIGGLTSDAQTQINAKIDSSEKGAVNGVATLDGNGLLPSSQLPISAMTFDGNYNASTNSPTLANTDTDEQGTTYRVNVAGTQDFGAGNITFQIGDWVYNDGSVWQKGDNIDQVTSVNSQTGTVVLDADDIDDSATTNKFATQAQLDKVDFLTVTQAVDLDTIESDLNGHLDGGASKHDATEVDYERIDGSKKNIDAASDDVETALTDLDDAIGSLDATPTNYTPTDATIVADHLVGIDTALASAGGSDFTDDTFRISDDGDNTKKIAFQASGITTSTTRTITMPDENIDLGALANDTLSNLGTTSINVDLLPSADSTRDLGSNTLWYAQSYVDQSFHRFITFRNNSGTTYMNIEPDASTPGTRSVGVEFAIVGNQSAAITTNDNALAKTPDLIFETGNNTGAGDSGDMIFDVGNSPSGSRGLITFDSEADAVRLATQPTGGVALAIATTQYVDNAVAGVDDASEITYTPSVLTDWDGDADPGNVDAALDQLAERVDDNEISISSNTSNISDNTSDIADIRTTQGTSDGDTNLGTFTGSTISDNTTVKNALQELETEVETKSTASAGDISETSFSAANNQVTPVDVTGLAFANGTVRSFEAQVSVFIDATANLYEVFTLIGIQKGASWDMSASSTGDASNIAFTITTAGQVQYTSGNEAGFVSNTMKFRAKTLSV